MRAVVAGLLVGMLNGCDMLDLVPVLRSPRLVDAGFLHGFSTRPGGVSEPPLGAMNLGRGLGDGPAAVAENHRRLAAAVGYAAARLFEISQVHGAQVVAPAVDTDPVAFRKGQGDALVASAPGQAVGVRTADCLALLLADPESGAVAAVHAGWRGTCAGVVPAAVRALGDHPAVRAQARVERLAGRLVGAIFPHIRPCCFEVGPDVAERLAAAAPAARAVRVQPHGGRPHVALAAVVTAQLAEAGVDVARIDDVPGCTVCDPVRFHSFRRDGARSGRHLAAIVSRTPRS